MDEKLAFERMLKSITLLKPQWPSKRTPNVALRRNTASPLPSMDNYRRIYGPQAEQDPSLEGFISIGFDELESFVNIAEVWGIEFTPDLTVLDWGVGCGRLARHLPNVVKPNFVGADVDPVNIEWCRDNLDFGRYEVLDTKGPLPFPDASVDLVYSFSVLTHLDRAHQELWLKELVRVLKPSGLMLLTVHGLHASAAFAEWAHDPYGWYTFFDRGFLDAQAPNPDICDVTPKEYYRDTAHTPLYVKNYWPLWGVDVLEIMPGGCGPAHDVVVCKRQS